MNAFDIVVTVIIAVSALAVTGWLIYKRVKRKGGCCDCGCSGCTACDKCKKNK